MKVLFTSVYCPNDCDRIVVEPARTHFDMKVNRYRYEAKTTAFGLMYGNHDAEASKVFSNIDYSALELRMAANLRKELSQHIGKPVWASMESIQKSIVEETIKIQQYVDQTISNSYKIIDWQWNNTISISKDELEEGRQTDSLRGSRTLLRL